MNPRFIAASLVLALLAPALIAVPIVQTATTEFEFEPASFTIAFPRLSFPVEQFDPANGPLDSVRLEVTFNVSASVWEAHPDPTSGEPVFWLPGLRFDVAPYVLIGGTDVHANPVVVGVSGPLLPVFTGALWNGSLTAYSNTVFTSPAQLTPFTGNGTGKIGFGGVLTGATHWGFLYPGISTATMTLTYNVPEHGSSFLLLLAFLVPALTFKRVRVH